MLKAVVFDFDGVLLESIDVKTRAFQNLFSGEKPEILKKIVDHHLKNGGVSRFEKFRFIYREILKRPLDKKEFNTLCERFAALVVDEVVRSAWVPGAREFLERNAGRYAFFIVSGTPEGEINGIVDRIGIRRFFKEVLGSPENKEILLKRVLEKHGLRAEEGVYIGDSESDWNAARAVKMPFVWRRIGQAEPLSGFTGPSVESLKKLESALELLKPAP